MRETWAAVVLTGGTGRRLGGVDKAGLDVGGRTLLDRALDAVAGAAEVVVVGADVPTVHRARPVRFVREDPPGSGPAAALLAGVDALTTASAAYDVVVVLAVDMPRVTAGTVDRLLRAVGSGGGAALDDGRRQTLCAAYRTTALLAAAPTDRVGLPVHRLVSGLRLAAVPARAGEGADVDTWSDLREIREEGLPGSGTGGKSSEP